MDNNGNGYTHNYGNNSRNINRYMDIDGNTDSNRNMDRIINAD